MSSTSSAVKASLQRPTASIVPSNKSSNSLLVFLAPIKRSNSDTSISLVSSQVLTEVPSTYNFISVELFVTATWIQLSVEICPSAAVHDDSLSAPSLIKENAGIVSPPPVL